MPLNAATRIASWADVVRSGTPSYPSTPNSRASTTASVKDRETVVKLDANSAAVLRKISPEDLCKRVNDALGSRINLLGKAPRVIAAKHLKSGDVVLHTATTAEADTLKSTEEEWAKVLGTTARVIKPTYGVIVHGVRTDKESIDTDNQDRAIEKIESENTILHEGAKVAYVGWLTKEGRRKAASSLVVEFTTKYHANRVIREGLVLNAIHHDCVLYDRSCRLKQCYRCHEYGHIGPQCDAEERCGYCAGAHNTKECIARDADPKPAPKCVLTLELKWGAHEETIIIHNVYNPVPSLEPTNSAITTLQRVVDRWKDAEQIVVGDFNLHHPYWGGLKVQTPDPEAEEALQIIEEYQLGLLYEPGTTTFRVRDTETTIDLSLATPSLQDSLIRCRPRDDLDHDSDHIPSETVLAKPSRNSVSYFDGRPRVDAEITN
ncbi:hypothetical protein CBS147353_11490 [Aspergillus niger]|nr:hypothetical protein CBS147353_11490 [Aspergillus niger]